MNPAANRQGVGQTGAGVGGGIAGIATKAEADSIKVYNERQKYNEWEFVYDMKKDKRLMGQQGAPGGMNGPGGTQPGGPGLPPNNPTGSGLGGSGFGGGSSFGGGSPTKPAGK
jgi:hypothetical protein